jgi:hypothetical protein
MGRCSSSCEEAIKPAYLVKQLNKLKQARQRQGVVVTTPEAIKSILLRFVDVAQASSASADSQVGCSVSAEMVRLPRRLERFLEIVCLSRNFERDFVLCCGYGERSTRVC